MTVTWPAALPAPMANDIEAEILDTRSHLQMESGQTRTVNKTAGLLHSYDIKWLLSIEQRQLFEHFYRFDLNDGANWATAAWLTALGHATHAFKMPGWEIIKQGAHFLLVATIYVLPVANVINPVVTVYPVSGSAA